MVNDCFGEPGSRSELHPVSAVSVARTIKVLEIIATPRFFALAKTRGWYAQPPDYFGCVRSRAVLPKTDDGRTTVQIILFGLSAKVPNQSWLKDR